MLKLLSAFLIFVAFQTSCSPKSGSKLQGLSDSVSIVPDPDKPGFLKVTCKDGSSESVASTALDSVCRVKPNKIYKKIASNHDGIFCAIDNNDELSCNTLKRLENDNGLYDIPAFLGKVKDVVVGQYMKCAIKLDDTVQCWGISTNGALEDLGRASTDGSEFKAIKVKSVAVSNTQICIIATKTNRIQCFGTDSNSTFNFASRDMNADKLTGGSSGFCATYGTMVECWNSYSSYVFPRDIQVLSTSGNGHISCVLDKAGAVDCHFSNEHSLQTSNPPKANATSLTVLDNTPWSDQSDGTACVTFSDKPAYCWGSNASGQTNLPSDLGIVKSIAMSQTHACAITAQGGLSCWKYGENTLSEFKNLGREVGTIFAGGNTTCATSAIATAEQTSLSCWGEGVGYSRTDLYEFDQSAHRDRVFIGKARSCTDSKPYGIWCTGKGDAANMPGMSMMLETPDYISVKGGDEFTCGLTADGDVHCWGKYSALQLAKRNTVANARKIAAGKSHACAIVSGNAVQCWGENNAGQTTVPANLIATKLVAGDNYTCAVTEDKQELQCWGRYPSAFPIGKTDIVTLSSGAAHLCLINNVDKLECYGDKGNLALEYPRDLPALRTVVSGSNHACVQTYADQKIICWGNNSHGQTAIPTAIPKDSAGFTDIQSRNRFDESTENYTSQVACHSNFGGRATCQLPVRPVYSFSGFSFRQGDSKSLPTDIAYDLEIEARVYCDSASNQNYNLVYVASNGQVNYLSNGTTSTLTFSNLKGPSTVSLRTTDNGSSFQVPIFMDTGSGCTVDFPRKPRIIPHNVGAAETAAQNIQSALIENTQTYNKITALANAEFSTADKIKQMLDGDFERAAKTMMELLNNHPNAASLIWGETAPQPLTLDFIMNDFSHVVPGELYGTTGQSITVEKRETLSFSASKMRMFFKNKSNIRSICMGDSNPIGCLDNFEQGLVNFEKDLNHAAALISLSNDDFSNITSQTLASANFFLEKSRTAMQNAKDLLELTQYVRDGLEGKLDDLFAMVSNIFTPCEGEGCYLQGAQQ